jgi:KDO2-lipid IV(A) lauroyltransferase
MVTAHYANFELIGYMAGLFGFDIYSVARPLDNKYLNRFLCEVRQRHGLKLIDKKGAAEMMPRIIEQGSTLGFIADQDAGRKGIFVDFFGRKASTYKSIGLLAITYNLPIVVGCTRRVGNRFFFDYVLSRIIFPHEWADKEDPLTWVSAAYTKAIEDFIRQDPTQYWWVHRRWKTRPREERQAAEAAGELSKNGSGLALPVVAMAPASAPSRISRVNQ